MNLTVLYKFTKACIHQFQSRFGIITLGAMAIIINDLNQILLVKHTYDPCWYIPGGGVKRGESTKTAILRELKEEVGLSVLEEPVLFAIYHRFYRGVNDYPVVYIVKKYSQGNANSPEIKEMGWFDYQQLPEMTSPGTRRRLTEYFAKLSPSDVW